jgi:flavin-dependent dehydrogenase
MENRREQYDLVIIGASFSGLTCARAAALRGLSVLVLEAKSDPGGRIHTTGILVKEAAEEIDVPAELTKVVHGVRLYAPNLKSVDLFSPGYYFLTTNTGDLIRWLADEARRAGVVIRTGVRFSGAERVAERLHIGGADVSCRYLVGADGARSSVAEHFGLAKNTRFLVGLEVEYADVSGFEDGYLHCFLDSGVAPGYIGWVAPAPGFIQVGLATKGSEKPDLATFRNHTSSIFSFDETKIVERRSGVIPCGGVVRPYAAPGVLLIGDAAGLVSPLSAGGIQPSFRYGKKAGQLIADYLSRQGPPPESVLEKIMPKFGKSLALRKVLDMAPPNFMYNAMLSSAPMRKFASMVYFHNRKSRYQSK